MVDLSLDLTESSSTYRDLLFENNDLVLTSDANPAGTNPILQDLLQLLSFYAGEWFLNNTEGFPWLQAVFVKNPNLGQIDALLQNEISSAPGVTQLLSYSSNANFEFRVLNVTFSVMTTSGKVNWSGNLPSQGATA